MIEKKSESIHLRLKTLQSTTDIDLFLLNRVTNQLKIITEICNDENKFMLFYQ